MFRYCIVFYAIALIFAVLAFGNILGVAAVFAQVVFGVCLAIAVVTLLLGVLRRRC